MKPVRVAMLVALFAAFAYGGWRFWDSSALELHRVEVAGNLRVAKEEIAAATHLRAGIHLLKVRPGEVAERVETLPWVASARVERIIPSKLRITVTERRPTVEVVVADRSYLADNEGMILQEGQGMSLRIQKLPLSSIDIGSPIESRPFHESLQVFEALDEVIHKRVSSIHAASVDRITLELEDSTLVVYGAAENTESKNYALTAILAEAAKQGTKVASIDLRVPNRPAVRPR